MKMSIITAIAALALCASASAGERHLLTEEYTKSGVCESFKAGARWFPLPDYQDRDAWKQLIPEEMTDKIVREAEQYLNYEWRNVKATAKMDWWRNNSRTEEASIIGENRKVFAALLYAELVEGKGRFMDQIVDGVWFYANQPTWVSGYHLKRQRSGSALPDPDDQIIDLTSAGTSQFMSFALYFFEKEFDSYDPLIAKSLRHAIDRFIFESYLDENRNLENWWLGDNLHKLSGTDKTVNNWNTWINCGILTSALLVQKDQRTLDAILLKAVTSLDRYLSYVREDGACEEGSSYWNHASAELYNCIYLLNSASGGIFDVSDEPFFAKALSYISRAYIGGPKHYVVNFADCGTTCKPGHVAFDYATDFGDSTDRDFSLISLIVNDKAQLPDLPSNKCIDAMRTLSRMPLYEKAVSELDALIKEKGAEGAKESLCSGIPVCTWYPISELAYVRMPNGMFFSAKGGHNAESHNHNDVGQFILYRDETPLVVDPSAPTYTGITFSDKRYTIWQMQSGWHNVPIINGVEQKEGREFATRSSSFAEGKNGSSKMTVDISGAYPEETGCTKWQRTFTTSGNKLKITDSFSLTKRISPDVEHLLIKGSATIERPGVIRIVGDNGKELTLTHSANLTATIEEKLMEDDTEKRNWGKKLTRINLTSSSNAPVSGKYEISFE